MAVERALVAVLTARADGARLEVREETLQPITVDVTWDDRLQLLAAIGAGLTAFAQVIKRTR
jgi:hypothetical protein